MFLKLTASIIGVKGIEKYAHNLCVILFIKQYQLCNYLVLDVTVNDKPRVTLNHRSNRKLLCGVLKLTCHQKMWLYFTSVYYQV
jgi:hypothetical protein